MFVVAIAAVDGFAGARFEGDFGVLTAGRTNGRVHLPGCSLSVATTVALALLSGGAAGGAALGFVGITLLREEILLVGGESKCSSAVAANDRLVLKSHG